MAHSLSPAVAALMANQPWALNPAAVPHAIAALERCAGQMEAASGRLHSYDPEDPGYDLLAGVAVIPVRGVLLNRLGRLRPYGSYATGYDGIRQAYLTAQADQRVRGIAFDIDSPGGMLSGLFDLADTIHAGRARKTSWAILSESAYSAAYQLASSTDRVTVPRTGGAGSIGVITMLVDFSGALSEAGIGVHFVHYGKHKAEEGRATYTGVKPDLLARLQAEVDRFGEMFVAAVARNRGLDPAAIRAQEARTYGGDAAREQGLADAVMAPDDAFRALLASLA
jgi:ClpP class serine protease